MNIVGVFCITLALILELLSYWKQMAKTMRVKHSKDVSTSAYLFKIAKYLLTMIGLFVYANYVGLLMEIVSLIICLITLYVVALYKPRGWHLWN